MLWIAVHLPQLSLESFAAGLALPADTPVALLEGHRIAAANAAAQALGVGPGLKRATALALAPRLVPGQADPARDLQALQAVAHAALAFTPAVGFDTPPAPGAAAPDTVLLEVQASLRCFGGYERLLQRLRAALAPLGHALQVASAPTAQGAAWLARLPGGLPGGLQGVVPSGPSGRLPSGSPSGLPSGLPGGRQRSDAVSFARVLDALPVGLIEPAADAAQALLGMGLHTLADLRRLPRAGLARRFGPGLLDRIDRALGLAPDPRDWVTLPPVFDARLELHARADTTEQVLYGAAVLLARLVAWASGRQVRVRRFTLLMQHEPRHRREDSTPAASRLELALAEPTCDAAHLQVLLRERLAACRLAAPTLELRLECDDVVHAPPPNDELFPTAGSEREGLIRLVERLQARLGDDQVQRLVQVQDHRPELGMRSQPVRADTLGAGRRVPAAKTASARRAGPAADPARQRGMSDPARPGTATDPVRPGMAAEPARAGLMADPARAGRVSNAARGRSAAASACASSGRTARTAAQAPVKPAETRIRVLPPVVVPRPAGAQPAWLLPVPQPLSDGPSGPQLDGRPLQLLCGPERIEAGWWDAGLAVRDYFIAQAADGALVWVYRARLPDLDATGEGWFLQGRFG